MPFLASAVLLAAASAALTVDYVESERFTDAGYERPWPSERERAAVQRDLTRHLQGLARRWLPAGTSLHLEVLDIDLAGRFEPFATRHGSDLRIVRDITWPRLRVRHTLTRADGTVQSAESQVSDVNYLAAVNRYPTGDRLRYEKAMLDRWFEQAFSRP